MKVKEDGERGRTVPVVRELDVVGAVAELAGGLTFAVLSEGEGWEEKDGEKEDVSHGKVMDWLGGNVTMRSRQSDLHCCRVIWTHFAAKANTRRTIDCPRGGGATSDLWQFISQPWGFLSTGRPASPNRQPGGAGRRWHGGCKGLDSVLGASISL